MDIDPWNTAQLSGSHYVSAILREDVGKYPTRKYRVRLPIQRAAMYPKLPTPCDHGTSICATWECIESWSVDYVLYLARTGGGRVIAAKLCIDPEVMLDRHDIEVLRHEDFVTEPV